MDSLSRIHEILLESSRPMSVSDLLAVYPEATRRTAQRHLSQLVAEGMALAQGGGRSRKYLALPAQGPGTAQEEFDGPPKHIPLSPDSRDIAHYISQPLEARSPVGYQRDFLDAYEPNASHYLPASIRRQLRRMGDTGQASRPAGTHGRSVLNRFLIDLSWASSHLEGNTYSRRDTLNLIQHGKAAEGKAATETQMILNHKVAIELLVENTGAMDFNRYTLFNLHGALSENLLPNSDDEGRIRRHQVEIGKSVYRPVSGEMHLSEILDSLLAKARQISDPFEQSFFMMVHLPYLQPFSDVNKRTSRLAANLPLVRENLCPLTFLDVPDSAYSQATLGVYEMTRVELLRDLYLWAYERSVREYQALRQDLAEPDPFRLRHGKAVKRIVREVVLSPEIETIAAVEKAIPTGMKPSEHEDLAALVIEELRRLHEGVLARYHLRPSQFKSWKTRQDRRLS